MTVAATECTELHSMKLKILPIFLFTAIWINDLSFQWDRPTTSDCDFQHGWYHLLILHGDMIEYNKTSGKTSMIQSCGIDEILKPFLASIRKLEKLTLISHNLNTLQKLSAQLSTDVTLLFHQVSGTRPLGIYPYYMHVPLSLPDKPSNTDYRVQQQDLISTTLCIS